MPGGIAARVAAWQRRMTAAPGPLSATGETGPSVPVTVEMWLAGAWIDITSDVMSRDGSGRVEITRGQSGEGSAPERGTCRFQLNNRHGLYSPRNPLSPYYGRLGRNTPLRVSVPGPDGKRFRFWGEATRWPQRWDLTGADVWVDMDAAGLMSRLEKGAAPVRSVLYNALTSADVTGLRAYWPCEDPDGSTRIAVVGAASRMTVAGTPQLAGSDRFGSSDPLPIMTGASLRGGVTKYAGTAAAQVRFLLAVPPDGVTDGKVICAIAMDSLDIATWELYYSTGGTVTLRPLDGDGATLAGGVAAFGDVRGRLLRVSIELAQNGANIDCAVRLLETTAVTAVSGTGALNSKTLTRVTSISMCPAQVLGSATRGMTDTAVGHVTLQNTITSITDIGPRLDPSGETAGRRMQRLCAERGIPFEAVGDLDTTVRMGPQGKATPLGLLTECAAADDGLLYESLAVLGLGYRTRASLYTQDPALVLSYPASQLSEVPAPVEDDQATRNVVDVSRPGGGTAHAELYAGPMSTADPPEGIGELGEQVTLNLQSDGDLPDQAWWRLHLGTVDEPRYPQITLNLARVQITPELRAAVLGLRPGDRVVITDPPAGQPPDDISLLVLGFAEQIDHFQHIVTLNCAPESPWRVTAVDHPVYGRADTESTVLVTDVSEGATALTVHSVAGPLWTTDPAEMPLGIALGGETVTVTGIASAVSDRFNRTITGGWGSTGTGQPWTTTGGSSSDYSVAGV